MFVTKALITHPLRNGIVASTHGRPCAPQFTDGGTKVVNNIGDVVLGILPVPATEIRQQFTAA